MSLPGTTVFELRQGSADTNGGGYDPATVGGTDWSLQANAQYAVTDGVTAGTSTITSATANFGTDTPGNLVYVSGGTGTITAARYLIVTRNSATSITVDRSTGLTTGTGVTLNIGGALGSIGGLGALWAGTSQIANGMKAWMKYSATPYSMTVATNNTSGGILTMVSGIYLSLEGYDVTRGDRTGNRPITSWASVAAPGSITYIFNTVGSQLHRFANLLADGNHVAKVGGFSVATARGVANQCIARNCDGTVGVGFLGSAANAGCFSCKADTCVTGFSIGTVDNCVATGCTDGFADTTIHNNCLAYANSSHGFSITITGVFNRCTADTNTTSGFNFAGTACVAYNCLATKHTGSGVGFLTTAPSNVLQTCAGYNNATNVTTGGNAPLINEGFVSLSSNPYVAQGSADFRPNNTATTGGALLRGTAIGVIGQTDNADIGAVQHTDPSSSGATSFVY